MDPMLTAFARVAESLTYQEPGIPLVSTVTGAPAGAELLTPGYWVRHVRETVRFADGVRALREDGVTTFVEIGPDGQLTAAAQQTLDASGDEAPATVVALQRRDRSEETTLLEGLATLHTQGAGPDWTAWFAGTGGHRVELPTYAFQRERYWPEPAAPGATGVQDPVDAAFWAAVEREDLESLTASLGLDGDTVTTMVPALSAWRRRTDARSTARDWRYHESWTALGTPAHPAGAGRVLALVPAEHAGTDWAETLVAALGADPLVVDGTSGSLARELADLVPQQATSAPSRRPLLDGQTSPAGALDPAGWTVVVSLLAAGTGTLPAPDAAPAAVLEALEAAGVDAPLWCVTRGAVSVAGEAPAAVGQAALWGMGRVAALEHPERFGGLADLAP
ncbi:acyltransferase domain-containing protein, partial [Streptomyces sp. SID2888]|uniref:acyltransferase domain-containing protein n=1 Tax=Streptomyces sp. SID2888 TaxID=2690256 RepID=UPI001F4611A5